MKRTQRTRRGVTIVELLVAAAMCIMGMWLLSWLYQQGLESFRQARAQADLTTQGRMFTQVITRDLTADHFDRDDKKPNGGKRVSDQRLDKLTLKPDPSDATNTKLLIRDDSYSPPKRGYFRARSLAVGVAAPEDANNVNITEPGDIFESSRSTNHFLQFTAILPGGTNYQQFSAEVPANQGKQWFGTTAEITYYLQFNGRTNSAGRLYDLYRSQRLVAKNGDEVLAYKPAVDAGVAVGDNMQEVMAIKGGNQIATLEDLTVPVGGYRFPGPAFTPNQFGTSARFSEDKLLSNVVSFEIKFTGTANPLWVQAPPTGLGLGLVWPRPPSQNTDYPYDTLPYDGVFDTFSTQKIGPGGVEPNPNWIAATNLAGPSTDDRFGKDSGTMKPIRITGVQIRLRLWDPKTLATRQTTVIIDL